MRWNPLGETPDIDRRRTRHVDVADLSGTLAIGVTAEPTGRSITGDRRFAGRPMTDERR
jgi:hypothetical protein